VGNPSYSYGAAPAIWDHLPSDTDTQVKVSRQVSAWFTYPGGMEGWVDLDVGYMPRWFTCMQTVIYPCSNHL